MIDKEIIVPRAVIHQMGETTRLKKERLTVCKISSNTHIRMTAQSRTQIMQSVEERIETHQTIHIPFIVEIRTETQDNILRRLRHHRAKVAVETFDDRIDPVGACVGVKGARIHGIVRELRNENIDVINYTQNTNLYIQRALAPAKISSMEIDEENKNAKVYLKPDEVSLAIGKGGFNIKLASRLTGYEIDVYREMDEADMDDIYLDEFNDEIDQWVIDALKAVGYDTAKDVLGTSKEKLLAQTDLEEETIDDVLRILAAEFENDYPERLRSRTAMRQKWIV